MIIDAHAHLGHDYVFDEEITEEELITQYRKDQVDGNHSAFYFPALYRRNKGIS